MSWIDNVTGAATAPGAAGFPDEAAYSPMIETQLAENQRTIATLRRTAASQALELKRLRESETALSKRCQQESESTERLWAELEKARSTIESRQQEWAQSKREAEAFLEKSTKLDRQKKRLEEYAEALNRDKQAVRSLARQLMDEVQAGQASHPLTDYLALTEYELSRVEIQLKKTPTIAADRAKLEQCLTEMIQQRDFLKSVISASREHAEKQAAALLKIFTNAQLAPTPPAPPPAPAQPKAQPASPA
jgi:hypothetical protein